MEIGWYLRFSRTGRLTVLCDHKNLAQLEEQTKILPEWSMEVLEEDGHLRADFTRTR